MSDLYSPNSSFEPKTRFDVADYTYFTQLGHEEYYTPAAKRPQAVFEHLYGYPTDIDKVWEAREELQNGRTQE